MGLFTGNDLGRVARSTIVDMQAQVEALEESLATSGYGLSALRAEDHGWALLSGNDALDDELDLRSISAHANVARALRVANPLVKRGITVRNSYIWGDPIIYPDSVTDIMLDPVNDNNLFSEEAQEELEAALNTDGQYFLLLDAANKQARQIPMREIVGVVTHPAHKGEVWYYRRSYTVHSIDENGQPKADQRDEYIPAVTYTGDLQTRIGEFPVNNTVRIEHATVNKQVGWKWGIPDLLGAVYWATAYKEYLEAQQSLSKALARIAFKVSNPSAKGQKAVAARMAEPVSRREAGGTATLGAGQDLVAVNKSGSGVDFAGGTPLAAMVAAALDVPLSVLLTDGSAGGRQGAENALEAPTINALNQRRKIHFASRKRILKYFGITDDILWPKIQADLTHRRLQALQIADSMNVLHPDEVRAAAIDALDIITDHALDDIPEPPPEPMPTAQGPGPLSDGTNDSRDTPGGATDA